VFFAGFDLGKTIAKSQKDTSIAVAQPTSERTAPTIAPQVPLPSRKAYYALSEIETMIGAMKRMQSVIDEKSGPLYSRAYKLYQSWEPAMSNESQLPDVVKIEMMADVLRTLAKDAAEIAPELQKIVFENQYYQDVLRPIYRDAKGSPGGMVGPLDRLISDLDAVVDLIGNNQPKTNAMFRILDPRRQEWFAEISNLGHWNGSVLARIAEKTKELRDWRND
jgi:hypothetical protein